MDEAETWQARSGRIQMESITLRAMSASLTWLRLAALYAFSGLTIAHALGPDPPARVARLVVSQGKVSLASASVPGGAEPDVARRAPESLAAETNWPLVAGD